MSNITTNLPLTEAFGEFIDLPAAKIIELQATGACPYIGKVKVGRRPDSKEMVALGFVEVCATTYFRRNVAERSAFFSHESGDRFMHIRGDSDGAQIAVAGHSQEIVDDLIDVVRSAYADDDVETADDLVPVRFSWYSSGARTKRRSIESPEWLQVADNYPGGTRAALEVLHGYNAGQGGGGRLLLFHGEPGTGKTTAVRSLARAWAPWCTATYIVDPETLFTVPEYLLEVALEDDVGPGRAWRVLREDNDDDSEEKRAEAPKWQLIIVEDVDELIRADAKNRTGQALGRLLNLTDGLLGQGLRTMFLLTTNEHMTALHPAIARPGRCLANIEFSTFTKHQANLWLAEHGTGARVDGDSVTLAQLYATCGAGVIAGESTDTQHTHGLYL